MDVAMVTTKTLDHCANHHQTSFLQARCPSRHPTNSIKALNAVHAYLHTSTMKQYITLHEFCVHVLKQNDRYNRINRHVLFFYFIDTLHRVYHVPEQWFQIYFKLASPWLLAHITTAPFVSRPILLNNVGKTTMNGL